MDENLHPQSHDDSIEDNGDGLDRINTAKVLASDPDIFWDLLGLPDELRKRTRELLKFGRSPFTLPRINKKNKLWPPHLKAKLETARDGYHKAEKRRTSDYATIARHLINKEQAENEARRAWQVANELVKWHEEAWQRWLRYLEVRSGPLTDRERRADARKIWRAVVDPIRAKVLHQHDQAIASRERQPHDDPLRLDKIAAKDGAANFFDEEAWLGEIAALDVEPEQAALIGLNEIVSLSASIDVNTWATTSLDDEDDGGLRGGYDYLTHGMYYLGTDRDRPISAPTDSRAQRAARELDAADRRARQAADEWLDAGGDPDDAEWDDDTDDDEATARERWLAAKNDYGLAAEKTRILTALKAPEVRAFVEQHRVFSSGFAVEPPDPSPPEDWGHDNVPTFLAAWGREWVREQTRGKQQTRFRLGKIAEHVAMPPVNHTLGAFDQQRSRDCIVKNGVTRSKDRHRLQREAVIRARRRREIRHWKRNTQNAITISRLKRRSIVWHKPQHDRSYWRWVSRYWYGRDADHERWKFKQRVREIASMRWYVAAKKTTVVVSDPKGSWLRVRRKVGHGAMCEVVDPLPARQAVGRRIWCRISETFLPWIVDEETDRAPTRAVRGSATAIDWFRWWKGTTPALASPTPPGGTNQAWHFGTGRIVSTLWRPILVVVRWLDEGSCLKPPRRSSTVERVPAPTPPAFSAFWKSAREQWFNMPSRAVSDQWYAREMTRGDHHATAHHLISLSRNFQRTENLGTARLARKKRPVDWKQHLRQHRARQAMLDRRHHATRLDVVGEVAPTPHAEKIKRGSYKTWGAT